MSSFEFVLGWEEYTRQQCNRLVELEKKNPNKKVIKQMVEQFEHLDFGCPLVKCGLKPEDIVDFSRKTTVYGNTVWFITRLFDYDENKAKILLANLITNLQS